MKLSFKPLSTLMLALCLSLGLIPSGYWGYGCNESGPE